MFQAYTLIVTVEVFSITGEVPHSSTRWCLNTGLTQTHTRWHTRIFKHTPLSPSLNTIISSLSIHSKRTTKHPTPALTHSSHTCVRTHKESQKMPGSTYRPLLCSFDMKRLPFHLSRLTCHAHKQTHTLADAMLSALLIKSGLHVSAAMISI